MKRPAKARPPGRGTRPSPSASTSAGPRASRTGSAQEAGAPPGFGAFLREHKVRRERVVQLSVLAGVTFFAFAAATALGFWRWYFAYANYGPAVVWRWASPAWAAGAGLFLLGTIQALRAARVARRRLHLYAGGIVWKEGRRSRAYAWADLQQIYITVVRYGVLGLVWGNHVRVTMLPARGPRLRLSEDLADLDSLLQSIKHSVYPRLLAESRQAFNAGVAIPFGPLTLHRDGIVRGRRSLPWSVVHSASLESGDLRIVFSDGKGEARWKVRASRIPNADLCLQLIQILGPEA